MSFKDKYGPWALVAGGSEGVGGAWSDRLATEGLNIVVSGRKEDRIKAKQAQLEADFGVETRGLRVDLSTLDAPQQVFDATKDLEIGFLVYNAGPAAMARFQDQDLDAELSRINVNVRSVLALTLHFAKAMVSRNRGGIVLMSSSGGVVGTPFVQTYSATKAYSITLAEALWAELADYNVDVMATMLGQTIGQSFTEVAPGTPGFQTAAEAVAEAMESFGKHAAVLIGDAAKSAMGDYFDGPHREKGILFMKQTFIDMMSQYGEGSASQ